MTREERIEIAARAAYDHDHGGEPRTWDETSLKSQYRLYVSDIIDALDAYDREHVGPVAWRGRLPIRAGSIFSEYESDKGYLESQGYTVEPLHLHPPKVDQPDLHPADGVTTERDRALAALRDVLSASSGEGGLYRDDALALLAELGGKERT